MVSSFISSRCSIVRVTRFTLKTFRTFLCSGGTLLFAAAFVSLGNAAALDRSSEQRAASSAVEARLQQLVERVEKKFGKHSRFGVSIFDIGADEQIFEHNSAEAFLPASVLKLVTSYVVLRELGANYQFETTVHGDRFPGGEGDIGALYLKGSGDPTFVTEDAFLIADELKRIGVRRIAALVVDDTGFIGPKPRSGPNPYQAAQSALSFNQNATSVRFFPSAAGKIATAALPEGTPIRIENRVQTVRGSATQIQLDEIPGSIQTLVASGSIGESSAGSTLYWSVDDPRANFVGVFTELLRRVGIVIGGDARFEKVPPQAPMLFSHRSKELSFILADLNRYSSNFIANQLTFALGCEDGRGCDLNRGIAKIQTVLRGRGISTESMVMEDGSGLSRGDRATPRQLVETLVHGAQEFAVFPDYTASLSRFGLTGTLKHRLLERREVGDVWAKTGTIDGVSSLAGYLQSRGGRRYAFVIISNGGIAKSDAEVFENEIVTSLLQLPS